MDYIKELLTLGYKGELSGRTDKMNTVIHASDFFGFCPRKFALCHKTEVPFHITNYIDTTLALTFDIGRKIQDIVIERLFKSGKLIGTWKCQICGEFYFGLYKKTCPFCEKDGLLKYIDTKVNLEIGNGISIIGNIDFQVLRGKDVITGEVKSIKKDDFIGLQEPLIQHQYQIGIYLYLLGSKNAKIWNKKVTELESSLDISFNKTEGVVLYIPKESVKSPFDKIFTYNISRKFMIEVANKIKQVKEYLKTGSIPEVKLCSSELSPNAKGCQVRKICLGS